MLHASRDLAVYPTCGAASRSVSAPPCAQPLILNSGTPRCCKPRRGLATIKVLLAIPSVAMLAWLGVEVGLVIRAANQAKAAADAIALAAAARFADGHDTARLDALTAAAASPGPNGGIVIVAPDGPAGGGDLVFGTWDGPSRTFSADDEGGPAVRATVRLGKDSPNGAPGIILAGLFNIGNITLSRTSTAVYTPPRHATALQLLGDSGTTLRLDGSSTFASRNGISVNSSSSQAVMIADDCELIAPVLRIAGGLSSSSELRVEGTVESGSTLPPDPLDSIALPPIDVASAAAIAHAEGATTLVPPGVHEQLEFSSGTVVLLPGLHQFVGSILLSGNARIELDSATIQLADGQELTMADMSVIKGSCAEDIGSWTGFALIQRGTPSRWTLSNTAALAVNGMAYGPNTRVTLEESASVMLEAAIISRIQGADAATLELSSKIEELDLPFIPGRARLVK